jgi:predicted phosphodiesterase
MDLPALIVGDLHLDERNLHLFRILKQQLKEYEEQVPSLVLIGDIFNSPDSVRWICLLEFIEFLEDTKFEVYMLTGNHDRPMYGQMLSNLSTFNRYGHVIKSPCVTGDSVVWLPHIGEQASLDFIKETPGRVCYSHQMIRGLMLNDKVATAQGLDKKEFQQQYEFTFNGHIHHPQIETNFFNIGSPWQHTFTEAGQRKFIWLFTGDKAVPVQCKVDSQYLVGFFEDLQQENFEGKSIKIYLQSGDNIQSIAAFLESHGATRWVFVQTPKTQEHSQEEYRTPKASLDELVVDFGFRKDLSLDDILMGLQFLDDR